MSNHKNLGIHFYMRETDRLGNFIEESEEIDLEERFSGLNYMSLDGMETFGKQKTYIENYADSDHDRVYLSPDDNRETFSVTLKLVFVGKDMYQSYYSFMDYVTKGFHAYWDTVRKRKLIFYCQDEVKPSDVKYNGSTKYIETSLKMTSVFGKTFPI